MVLILENCFCMYFSLASTSGMSNHGMLSYSMWIRSAFCYSYNLLYWRGENGAVSFSFCWMHCTWKPITLRVNFQQGIWTSSEASIQVRVQFRWTSCTSRKRKFCMQACFYYYCTSVPIHSLILSVFDSCRPHKNYISKIGAITTIRSVTNSNYLLVICYIL